MAHNHPKISRALTPGYLPTFSYMYMVIKFSTYYYCMLHVWFIFVRRPGQGILQALWRFPSAAISNILFRKLNPWCGLGIKTRHVLLNQVFVFQCMRNVFVKLQRFQPPRFAVRTLAYTSYGRTKKKLPVNTVSQMQCLNVCTRFPLDCILFWIL